MPKLKIDELNKVYREAEVADREIFAEQRSNVLLIAGEHYSRRGTSRTNNRLRANADRDEMQKLRLTKNHCHKVVRQYTANILSFAPGVSVSPKNETELQDIKSAELNEAVWQDGKERYKLKEKTRKWISNFVGIGEVCTKIFYDPMAGDFVGYAPKTDEFGQPAIDETGAPVADEESPQFTGGFVFEEVYGFNLLRHAAARDMSTAECWIIRKMVDTEALKAKYKGDDEKLKMINEGQKTDFIVFDSDRAAYNRTEDQTLVREFYWPVGPGYEQGYFAITTEEGILEEGPLPGGHFPLVWKGFDEYPSTPRGRSILKVARPFQAEINRASSQVAMHQITIGDDKVLYQAGTKLQPGALLPGVRGISYAGAAPTILNGRDGGQYLPYIESQIAEMYDVLMLQEDGTEKNPGQVDAEALLYRSLKQQKRFSEYGEKFEEFLCAVCELYLKLCKIYLDDSEFIAAVGKSEQINISEFKATDSIRHKIVLEPRDETLETQFGRQLTMNHILQYASGSLSKDDIGKIIANMPYGNTKEQFSDLTLDYDCVKNDMLQMERGKMPPLGKYDDPNYVLRRLVARTRQADYQFLPPVVKEIYAARINAYEGVLKDRVEKEAALKNEYIPSNGAMIATDMYVANPGGPDKPSKRVRIPYQALDWLVQRLESQGQSLQAMETQNHGVITEMAGMLANKSPNGPMPSGGGVAFKNAPASALGVS